MFETSPGLLFVILSRLSSESRDAAHPDARIRWNIVRDSTAQIKHCAGHCADTALRRITITKRAHRCSFRLSQSRGLQPFYLRRLRRTCLALIARRPMRMKITKTPCAVETCPLHGISAISRSFPPVLRNGFKDFLYFQIRVYPTPFPQNSA